VWRSTGGNYYKLPKDQHPVMGVAFGWSVLSLTGFDLGFRSTQYFAAVQPDIFYWSPPNPDASKSVIARAKIFDAVDLVWRNRTAELHNVNAQLGRVEARTVVMHITNDQWLNYKLAQKAVERLPGADLLAEESPV